VKLSTSSGDLYQLTALFPYVRLSVNDMFADLSLSRSSSKQCHTVKTALVSLQMTQIPTGLFKASETLRKYTIRYKSTVIAILETFILLYISLLL